MTEEKKIQYLPFHAVNEFMRDDYRLVVLQEVFSSMEKCTNLQRQLITRLVSRGLQIPGFRNSSQAPVSMRIKHSASLFEKSSEFAATIMECWSNLHQELKKIIVPLLKERGWNPQPLELDRSLLPGFMIDWPKTDTFEVLIKAVREAQPTLDESDDNICLMVVWMGNRLPYDLFVGEKAEEKD